MKVRICRDCNNEFILTDSEIEFYNKNGLTIPKRCKQCREANKSKKKNKSNTISSKIATAIISVILIAIIFISIKINYSDSIFPLLIEGISNSESSNNTFTFRNNDLLEEHYSKHGIQMGFSSAQEYETAANNVINSVDVMAKIEKEDGDTVYYLEKTNEFVVLSTDGYLRTYFYPDDGKSYFDRQ